LNAWTPLRLLRSVVVSVLILAAMFAAGCAPASSEEQEASKSADSSAPILATESGSLRGLGLAGVATFRGIPFAAPPIGDARWKPPQPVAGWSGVRDATAYGSRCAQKDLAGNMVGAEDCLFLNVWAPASAATGGSRPVMFFIHGGANVIGASNDDVGFGNLYDGETLARERGAVVVTANYRLGPLGFLAHPALGERADPSSGNLAILDLIAALRWVAHNISAVGGDPARVMIFGESAGALNTCVLLGSPLARGLFSRVLMESGECTARPRAEAEDRGAQVATSLGCSSGDVAACLRGKTPEELFAAPTPAPNALAGWDLAYAANVDGVVLSQAPLAAVEAGAFNRVPVVVGSNANEMEFFFSANAILTCADYDHFLETSLPTVKEQVSARYPCASFAFPRWAAVAASTDLAFTCPARRLARAASKTVSTYRYFYTHVRSYGPLALLRAYHTAELPFVFGTLGREGAIASFGETDLASRIRGYWSELARAGTPSGSAGLTWAPFDREHEEPLVLDDVPAQGQGASHADDACDFWDGLTSLASLPSR
jgi:para-nitrobenzyl esterase